MKPELYAAYYNYRTGEHDYLTPPPQDWSDYIPQHSPAQSLYRLHQEMGKTPIEAALLVLESCVKAQELREGDG